MSNKEDERWVSAAVGEHLVVTSWLPTERPKEESNEPTKAVLSRASEMAVSFNPRAICFVE